MIHILNIWTQDNLRLQGIHYELGKKNTCVLLIHGMSGNFIENYFGVVLGEYLQQNGYGFIYAHNRGYNHINDVAVNEVDSKNAFKTKRVGAVYERFGECVFDIDAWVKKVFDLGYKEVILVGHSLGCNKVIHYLYKNISDKLTGLILLSPPDMVANGKESG
jgi:predicted alpha/beta-fold hydrolase